MGIAVWIAGGIDCHGGVSQLPPGESSPLVQATMYSVFCEVPFKPVSLSVSGPSFSLPGSLGSSLSISLGLVCPLARRGYSLISHIVVRLGYPRLPAAL